MKPVYIIGAGPGDPERLTMKAHRLIHESDVIIFTGSLVPKSIFDTVPKETIIIDSASLTLDEIIELIQNAVKADQSVSRVHTGDPSLFGSTAEQMRRLKELGIPYEIIPGVSSFNASAAAAALELTLPEISQTVVITRMAGRTPVPEKESLEHVAKLGATIVLFLSITLVRKVVRTLKPYYGGSCPVVIVHKASCPDQVVLKGTLDTIVKLVTEHGITSQSIILVGKVLDCHDFPDSRLYAADFSHKFRKASHKAHSS